MAGEGVGSELLLPSLRVLTDGRFEELCCCLRRVGGALCGRHLAKGASEILKPAGWRERKEEGLGKKEVGMGSDSVPRFMQMSDAAQGDNPPLRNAEEMQGDKGSQIASDSLQIAYEMAWEALHSGPWKDVKVVWRDAFALAGLLQALEAYAGSRSLEAMRALDMAVLMGGPMFRPEVDALIRSVEQGMSGTQDFTEVGRKSGEDGPSVSQDFLPAMNPEFAKDAAHEIPAQLHSERDAECDVMKQDNDDLEGELAGGRKRKRSSHNEADAIIYAEHNIDKEEERGDNLEESADKHLQQKGPSLARDILPDAKKSRNHQPTLNLPPGSFQSSSVPRQNLPSVEEFLLHILLPAVPTIITGALTHWPAMARWQDLSYLRKVAGARTVPLEVGEHYLAEGWRQELTTVGDFIDRHLCDRNLDTPMDEHGEEMSSKKESIRYLAQHPLFEQIPQLKQDICPPEYCSLGSIEAVNAWIGPAGTVSPLHCDPPHNLLAQVVGRKYVRLYSSKAGEDMYPYTEMMLHNSSQVDLDAPDHVRFPRFCKLSYWDCVLEEGEMLYIPPKWWHYVRSLSRSFSVSFWWSMAE